MDLSPTTIITQTSNTKTPPPPPQPTTTTQLPNNNKVSSFTNGSLKPHNTNTAVAVPPPPPPPPPQLPMVVFSYKECLKNHAATIGGHALDGCGEFMPSSSSNPSEPRSLTCAACGCHRNFHRRDHLPNQDHHHHHHQFHHPNFLSFYHSPPQTQPQHPPASLGPHRGLSISTSPSPSPSPSPSHSPNSSPSPPPLSHHFPPASYNNTGLYPSAPPNMLLALGNHNACNNSDSDHDYHHQNQNHRGNLNTKAENIDNHNGHQKKRYRTKFSQEQKEKMLRFSEKVGWRMQRGDEALVQEFCNEVGVSRGVFKVWMHNNKNNFRKRPLETTMAIHHHGNNNDAANTVVDDGNNNVNNGGDRNANGTLNSPCDNDIHRD